MLDGVIHAITTRGITATNGRRACTTRGTGMENDPREALMRELDLPRGDERELVVDRDQVYVAFAERILPRASDCGFKRRLTTSSGSSSCSSRKESRTTEIDSIEPPQRHHFSTTWRGPRALMKEW
jgi:hypothetical protein